MKRKYERFLDRNNVAEMVSVIKLLQLHINKSYEYFLLSGEFIPHKFLHEIYKYSLREYASHIEELINKPEDKDGNYKKIKNVFLKLNLESNIESLDEFRKQLIDLKSKCEQVQKEWIKDNK